MKTLKPILVIALFLGAYVAFEAIDRSRNKPPATVQTFDDYMRWQTKHRYVQEWQSDGQSYVLMSGANAGLLPSGSTVYVFDSSGRMVDWTLDGGDDSRFQDKWYERGQRHEITLEKARQRFAATRPAI